MKTSLKLFAIGLFTLLSAVSTNVSKSQVSANVSFSVFHDNLQAYGRWVGHSRYGQVWIPRVSGFRPYSTGGHWTYTDSGWTWVSDYNWGWAPFHYGRWAYDPLYGWVWIPGYEWGPAWVSWRTGGDYYGWAPLGPDASIGIGVAFGTTIPTDSWVFVPRRYITSPAVYRYYVPRARNVTIIKNTTIINNTHEANVFNRKTIVVGGPKREDVERVAQKKVQVMHINDASRPGSEVVDKSKNTINVYRPVINKTTVNKNVTINNNKETTINNSKKATTNQANRTTVNNNKPVNKDDRKTVNNGAKKNNANTDRAAREAKRTAINKETTRNGSTTNVQKSKQAQKNAPADAGKQNVARPDRNSTEERRLVEKRPTQKPNREKQDHKPAQESEGSKIKRSEASVRPSQPSARISFHKNEAAK